MELCGQLSFCQVKYRFFRLIISIPNLSRIVWYSVDATEDAAFVIGGSDTSGAKFSVIAQFKDNEWFRYGNLQKPRQNQASITSGNKTMIIGGLTNDDR